jgi:hypothetical protein
MAQNVKSVITTPHVDDVLQNVDKAHLIEAIRLIARNLAHIRKLLGITPFFTIAESLDSREMQVREELEEMTTRVLLAALGATAACDNASPAIERTTSSEEKRASSDQRLHIRIKTAMPVSVRPRDAVQYLEAILWDMSWGGARISCDSLDAKAGDAVELNLVGPDNEPLKARAIIQRRLETNSSAHRPAIQYALQFTEFSLESDRQFRKLLQRMLGTLERQGCLQDPTLASQLELEYTDPDDLARLMAGIPQGKAEVMLPTPIRLYDRIIVVIYEPGGSNALDLRAKVVKQELVSVSGVALYRVNLEFEHPNNELRERVQRIMGQLTNR